MSRHSPPQQFRRPIYLVGRADFVVARFTISLFFAIVHQNIAAQVAQIQRLDAGST